VDIKAKEEVNIKYICNEKRCGITYACKHSKPHDMDHICNTSRCAAAFYNKLGAVFCVKVKTHSGFDPEEIISKAFKQGV